MVEHKQNCVIFLCGVLFMSIILSVVVSGTNVNSCKESTAGVGFFLSLINFLISLFICVAILEQKKSSNATIFDVDED